MRVLIAEDFAPSARLLEVTLRKGGYQVTLARNGVEALAAMGAAVRTCMRALQAESPRIPGFAPLAARLGELAEGLPEASWPQPVIEADVPESEPAEAAAKDVELTASDDLGQYLGADADADAGGERLPVAADAPSTEPAFAAAAGVAATVAVPTGRAAISRRSDCSSAATWACT